jgi:hypothetical protein
MNTSAWAVVVAAAALLSPRLARPSLGGRLGDKLMWPRVSRPIQFEQSSNNNVHDNSSSNNDKHRSPHRLKSLFATLSCLFCSTEPGRAGGTHEETSRWRHRPLLVRSPACGRLPVNGRRPKEGSAPGRYRDGQFDNNDEDDTATGPMPINWSPR